MEDSEATGATSVESDAEEIDTSAEVNDEEISVSLETKESDETDSKNDNINKQELNNLEAGSEEANFELGNTDNINSEELESVATNGTTQGNENEEFIFNYDTQPQSKDEIKSIIYDYWFNNSTLPKFEDEVSSELLPSAWNCVYIGSEEGNYYTLELDFSFTPQPTSIDDVQESIDLFLATFDINTKPIWQFVVDDSLMPNGYSCDMIYNEGVGVRYYSWLAGITAIANETVTIPFSGNAFLSSTIVEDALALYGGKNAAVNVIIGNGFTSIGNYAFRDCTSLISITIPEGVTSIKYGAFMNCSSLTSINIPNNLLSIEQSAFSGCSSLISIVIPEGVTTIENSTFSNCSSLISITIPEGVTSIGTHAFWNCSALTSIIIPEGITTIGNYTFNNCSSLESINIPASVTSIGDSAFANCTSLTSITIPASATSIGFSAFRGCTSLQSITIPNDVTSIEERAFDSCTSLTSINIPNGVTSIDMFAFNNCSSLTSITIPATVTSIGQMAFSNCTSLTYVVIPDSVTSIGNSTFYGCTSLTSIVIPTNVTAIGNSAFMNCASLTSVTIGNGVESIGNNAFYNCSLLQSITIPSTVTSIEAGAFAYCTSLKSILVDRANQTGLTWADISDYGTKVKYLKKPLTVTFNSDGGSAVSSQTLYYNNAVTKPANPTKTGYTFQTWNQGATAFNFTTFKMDQSNITLTAIWNINNYTLTVNSVTGGTISGAGSKPFNSSVTLTATPATGYTFGGWQTNAYLTGTNLTFVIPDNDVTLTPIFEPKSYTITFDYNGATDHNGTIDKAVIYDASIGSLPNPTKIGYNFVGWFTNNDIEYNSSTVYLTDDNTTLTAKWEAESYTITFDYNGATSNNDTTDTSVTYDAEIGPLPEPIKIGHTFIGWFDSFDNQYNVDTIYLIDINITLMAKYSINNYTLSINSVTGGSVTGADSIPYNSPVTLIANPDAEYAFTGWLHNDYLTGADLIFTMPANDVTLTPIFTINQYTVSFNSNSGSAVTAKTQNYNTSVTAPTNPTRTGYTFDGWYGDSGLTNKVSFPYTITNDATLYAKWELKTAYNVTFNPNNNVQSKKTIEVDEGSLISEPKQPVKLKHKFMGWYYGNKEWDFRNDIMVSEDIELIARWQLVNRGNGDDIFVPYNRGTSSIVSEKEIKDDTEESNKGSQEQKENPKTGI